MRRMKGIALIELMVVAAIISILSVIGVIGWQEYSYRAQVSQSVGDIRRIETALYGFFSQNAVFPPALADVGMDALRDPWNRPYAYWPITGDPKQKVRKDKNLHPLNTDFDLFSVGRDGDTHLALTAKASHDDIIRASDGKFVDLAVKY